MKTERHSRNPLTGAMELMVRMEVFESDAKEIKMDAAYRGINIASSICRAVNLAIRKRSGDDLLKKSRGKK